jgi:hypothetical protein
MDVWSRPTADLSTQDLRSPVVSTPSDILPGGDLNPNQGEISTFSLTRA